ERLQHLAELSGRDGHREAAEEDEPARPRRKRDPEPPQVEVPLEEAERPVRDDRGEDEGDQRPAELAQRFEGRGEVRRESEAEGYGGPQGGGQQDVSGVAGHMPRI